MEENSGDDIIIIDISNQFSETEIPFDEETWKEIEETSDKINDTNVQYSHLFDQNIICYNYCTEEVGENLENYSSKQKIEDAIYEKILNQQDSLTENPPDETSFVEPFKAQTKQDESPTFSQKIFLVFPKGIEGNSENDKQGYDDTFSGSASPSSSSEPFPPEGPKRKRDRKNGSDNVKKKIKTRFFRELKKKINEKFEKFGLNLKLYNISRAWTQDTTRKKNRPFLGLTFKKIMVKLMKEEKLTDKSAENKKVLDFFDDNPSLKSEFKEIFEKTYEKLFTEYIKSEEFESFVREQACNEKKKSKGCPSKVIDALRTQANSFISFFKENNS